MRKNIISLLKASTLFCLLIISSCSSDDDSGQVFVLQPDAGKDQVVETNSTVNLTGKEDGNSTNYTVEWSFTEKPANSNATITNADNLNASFVPDVAGNYVLSLKTAAGSQNNADAIVITVVDDITTVQSKVIFVNAIEGSSNLVVSTDGEDINANGIAPFAYSEAYESVFSAADKEYTFTMGNVVVKQALTLEAEKNYTIVVTGTTDAPEIILHENQWNEKTIGATTADDGVRKNDAINAIHAAPGLGKVKFHLTHPLGSFTLNFIIKFRNTDEEIIDLDYKESDDALIGHNNTAFPTTNWVQDATDTDTDATKALSDSLTVTAFGNGKDSAGWFITMLVVKDSAATTGYRIIYINNTDL